MEPNVVSRDDMQNLANHGNFKKTAKQSYGFLSFDLVNTLKKKKKKKKKTDRNGNGNGTGKKKERT